MMQVGAMPFNTAGMTSLPAPNPRDQYLDQIRQDVLDNGMIDGSIFQSQPPFPGGGFGGDPFGNPSLATMQMGLPLINGGQATMSLSLPHSLIGGGSPTPGVPVQGMFGPQMPGMPAGLAGGMGPVPGMPGFGMQDPLAGQFGGSLGSPNLFPDPSMLPTSGPAVTPAGFPPPGFAPQPQGFPPQGSPPPGFGPIPVEPNGGIGDGAGPPPGLFQTGTAGFAGNAGTAGTGGPPPYGQPPAYGADPYGAAPTYGSDPYGTDPYAPIDPYGVPDPYVQPQPYPAPEPPPYPGPQPGGGDMMSSMVQLMQTMMQLLMTMMQQR